MADLKEISMKRKRLSLPVTRSLAGSFGRSKSQIQRSRNHNDLHPFVKKLKNSSPAEGSPTANDLSAVSIKDLRLRRVFSPSSTDGVIPNSFDAAENQSAGIRLGGKQESFENGDFRKLDVSNEDFVQSTPPDTEIFGAGPVVERNGTEFSDQFLEKKPCERNGTSYSMKSVLKPCSRARLFKTPGSFSYRRLLPYLMDIENDNSGPQIMGQCQKSEKGFEDKHLSASNGPETLPDKATSCSLDVHNTDSGKLLIAESVESSSKEIESSLMPLVNGEIQRLELQASCEDHNRAKNGSASTIEDSHLTVESLAGVVSSDQTLADNGEVAQTNVEYPCNARSLEVLDQTLSTLKCESCHCEVPESSKVDTRKPEMQGMPNATVCHSLERRRLNSVVPALSENAGNRKCSLQPRVDNDDEVVERVEDLNGECMSMTPPDSDMSSKYEINDSRGKTMAYVSQGIDQVIQKSTNETLCRNNGQDCDKSPDSSPKNNMVPNPHLHLKLSKIPGSFSYRRLLPYLLNITSHNSRASGSPFITYGKETCTETFNNKNCPVEHHTGDGIKMPVVTATSMSSSNRKVVLSPPKQVAESPMIMDSRQEPAPLVKPSASDTTQKVESRPKDVVESPDMSSSSLINSSLLPREDVPLETEEDSIKSTEKCAYREKQIQADSFAEASTPPGIPSATLRKGILKRNPRGCRGICTCLNCSSFRLHAERSFEFSRNQMQDAEEVALDLIKEISYLRDMLEKFAFIDNGQTNVCMEQVEKACKKASDAEHLAKARLSEMNYHLNIHCRIPLGLRPSVRFADHVEEHSARPTSDSSNK